LAAFFTVALLQILAVLILVHYRLFGAGRLMVQAAALLTLAALTKWNQFFLLPLLPCATPAGIFALAIGDALSLTEHWMQRMGVWGYGGMGEWTPHRLHAHTSTHPYTSSPWSHLVLTTALYALTLLVYTSWRTADRERAREALIRRYDGRGFLASWLRRRLDEPVAAQVVRDWQLTRRGFSSAVYLALGFAVLFQGVLIVAARRYSLSPEWFSKIAQICCAFSVFSLTALAPLLVKYQLPYFWVEKSTGLSPEAIWKAKFWYARLAAIPALVLSVLVVTPISPFPAADHALLILKLFIIAFMVASLIGVMAFEIAPRPLLLRVTKVA
jgi:hypothetical protein